MDNIVLPLSPTPIISINNVRIGMVQCFEERRETGLKCIGSIGSQEADSILPMQICYRIRLRRLLLDPAVFSEELDLYRLHAFTLSMCNGKITVTFHGCEFSVLACRYESDQICAEEAEITASYRTMIA